MPLRDHFRSPLDALRSWDELHSMLPAVTDRPDNRAGFVTKVAKLLDQDV